MSLRRLRMRSLTRLFAMANFDACYQEKALEEMFRGCKNNGYIILTGKNDNYFADDE